MSVQRVMTDPAEPVLWATPDRRCFYCGKALRTGELAVAWSANDGDEHTDGMHFWHEPCALTWNAAFGRDAWEAHHATTHLPGPGPDTYAEPDWAAGMPR